MTRTVGCDIGDVCLRVDLTITARSGYLEDVEVRSITEDCPGGVEREDLRAEVVERLGAGLFDDDIEAAAWGSDR